LFSSPPAAPSAYTLSLHDALPIWSDLSLAIASIPASVTFGDENRSNSSRDSDCSSSSPLSVNSPRGRLRIVRPFAREIFDRAGRSEEHTSELQSRENLVCRLLLEK